MKQIIFFVISLFLFACNKDENLPSYIENEDGVTLSQPFLWKTNLTNSGYIGTLIRPSLIYNDNIILGAFNDKKCEIALIDIESGEKEWQKPYFSKEFALTNSAYMYKNLAFCDSEVDDFHCLDMVTGSIIWKIDKEGWFEVQSPTGINETCFMCGASENNPKPYEVQAVWYGDINTGDVNELYYPDLGSEADTCYNVRNYNQAGVSKR